MTQLTIETTDKPWRNKPKTPQAATPKEAQARDQFLTPDYATDLIVPYIRRFERVWEPAAGPGKMVARLREFIGCVMASSIEYGQNFLDRHPDMERYAQAIVTNPPYSLKTHFVNRCMEIGRPWALLVPADLSGWNLTAVRDNGCQWLIPTRRVDYITPNILTNIHEGEIWKRIRSCTPYKKLSDYIAADPDRWQGDLNRMHIVGRYESINDVPPAVLDEYSASQFHSGWLTWGLNLPDTLTIVDLPIEAKRRGYLLEEVA